MQNYCFLVLLQLKLNFVRGSFLSFLEMVAVFHAHIHISVQRHNCITIYYYRYLKSIQKKLKRLLSICFMFKYKTNYLMKNMTILFIMFYVLLKLYDFPKLRFIPFNHARHNFLTWWFSYYTLLSQLLTRRTSISSN